MSSSIIHRYSNTNGDETRAQLGFGALVETLSDTWAEGTGDIPAGSRGILLDDDDIDSDFVMIEFANGRGIDCVQPNFCGLRKIS